MAEKKWCVYMHTNKINGKKYIGITSYPTIKRWGTKGQGYKTQYFNRAITKYGWDNFEHEVLFNFLEEKIAKEKEIELIAKYKTKDKRFGYNLTDGGDGTIGVVLSDNARENMRISHLGQVAWNKGLVGKIKVSEKTILKKIELWKNEEYRARQSKSHTGNKQSEATKKKISENHSRISPIYQLDLDGNIVCKWDRIKSAVDIGGFNSSGISGCCSNKLFTTKGYIFMYENDYNIDNVNKKVDIVRRNMYNINPRKVYKYDENMIFLKEYKSSQDVENQDKISKSTIRKYCTNKLQYNGFYWRMEGIE